MTGMIAAAGGAASSLQGNGVFNYWLIMALMMTGLYLILSRSNMIKTIIGLNFFQVSVIMLYVSMGKIEGATAPILVPEDTHHEVSHDGDHGDAHGAVYSAEHAALVDTTADVAGTAHPPLSKSKPQAELKPTQAQSGVIYSNPLPHVLMLTAIVVGVATTALALSLVVRILSLIHI